MKLSFKSFNIILYQIILYCITLYYSIYILINIYIIMKAQNHAAAPHLFLFIKNTHMTFKVQFC
jgi:hypothetical protein